MVLVWPVRRGQVAYVWSSERMNLEGSGGCKLMEFDGSFQ